MNTAIDTTNPIDLIVSDIIDDPYVTTGEHNIHDSTVSYFKRLGHVVLLILTTSLIALVTNTIKS